MNELATQPPGRRASLLAILLPLFAISGASALVLQTVWVRWLTIALGSSTRAIAVVLAVFMAGLGCGAWLGGRLADRSPEHSARWFAWAELSIAAWALCSIPLLRFALPGIAAGITRFLGAAGAPGGVRVALAVAVLLPPTALMGATLPLLVRWVVGVGVLPARGVGSLYAANTLGGAAGVFAATFWLIPSFGLTRTAVAAGLSDLAVAACSFFLPRAESETRGAEVDREAVAERVSRLFVLAAAGYFVSGFVGLALEIVVQRLLVVLAGSTVYAFAVMLIACLVGIALGSAAAFPLAGRVKNPAIALAVALGALAVGIGSAVRLCDAEAWQTVGRWGKAIPAVGSFSYAFELTAYFVTVLPAMAMLGAIVPFVGRIAAQVPGRFAERCGLAYSFNTAGAILGIVLAGSVLVPTLGTGSAMAVLATIAALAGLFLALFAPLAQHRGLWVLVTLSLGALGVAAAVGRDPARASLAALVEEQVPGSTELLYFREGPVQTVAVVAVDSDATLPHLRIIANRVSLTATAMSSQRYMRLLGHLPGLWTASEPRRALVICLGTGITASAVAEFPSLEWIDIAEISPEIVDAAPLLEEVSHGVLEDPRVHLHIEDGRHVMLSAASAWDLITLEPPPPRESGVVSLYTREFYELCRRRLTPGGTVAQWIPLHSLSKEELRSLVQSFVESFPHVLGFLPIERDLILLGSAESLQVDPASLERRFAALGAHGSLERVGFESAAVLLGSALLDRAALVQFAGDRPPVTDDRPRVEYFLGQGKAPALPEVGELIANPLRLDQLVRGQPRPEFAEQFGRSRRALLAALQGEVARAAGRTDEADALRQRALEERPADPYYLWSAGLSDEHLARLRRRAENEGSSARSWVTLAVRYSRRGLEYEALDALRNARARAPEDPEVLLRLGLSLRRRTPEEAREGRGLLERFLALAPEHPAAGSVRDELARADR